MRLIALFILFVIFASVNAGSDKNRGGFAAHIGLGSLYGGGGASVEYQFPVSPLWRVTPFISAGSTMEIYSGNNIHRVGYCAGVNAEFGRRHRLFIGPSFGSHYLDYDRDSLGNLSNVNTVVGPAVVLGYKGTARFGLLWLVYGGLCYLTNDRHPGDKGFAPALGFLHKKYFHLTAAGHDGKIIFHCRRPAVPSRKLFCRRSTL